MTFSSAQMPFVLYRFIQQAILIAKNTCFTTRPFSHIIPKQVFLKFFPNFLICRTYLTCRSNPCHAVILLEMCKPVRTTKKTLTCSLAWLMGLHISLGCNLTTVLCTMLFYQSSHKSIPLAPFSSFSSFIRLYDMTFPLGTAGSLRDEQISSSFF